MIPPDDPHWLRLREQVPQPLAAINLNAGSFSPVPRPVHAAAEELRRQFAASPSDFLWRRMPGLLDRARTETAGYLDARPADLLILLNVTFALNLVVRSLKYPAGSRILCSDQEYGAMNFCWQAAAAEHGWELKTVSVPPHLDDEDVVDRFDAARDGSVRAVFFSHVTSPTGHVLPARRLCAWARGRGLHSVIDGAHAVGMIPLSVRQVDADFYGGNLHKWLMAPPGAGFLHVRPELRDSLRPLVTSWGHGYAPDTLDVDSGWGGSFWAREQEYQGTLDRFAQAVLPEVLAFRRQVGSDAEIAARVDRLATHLCDRMAAVGHRPAVPQDRRGALVAFPLEPVDVLKARDWMWHAHHIECPTTEAAGRHYLRVSTAWFNTPAELDRLADAVRTIPYDQLR